MKNSFLTASAVLVLIITLSGCSPNRVDNAFYRGNLERTGTYPDDQIPQGILVWQIKSEAACYSSPVISQGLIFLNCAGGYLYALNDGNGQQFWVFKRDDAMGSSPAVSNDMVFVGGFHNYVYAVNIKTGSEKWRFKTGDKVLSSPAVSDGILYVGSYDGYFYAIDVTTGNEKWKFATKGSKEPISTEAETGPVEGSPGAIVSSPAISKGVVYFGSSDEYLYALDTNTGKEKWKFKTENDIVTSPAISEGVIYFGSQDGDFYAIDDTGELKWKFDTKTYATISSPPGGTPFFSISSGAVSNGIVYFSSDFDSYFGRQDYLFAVDTKSGEMKWKNAISKAGYGAPTVSNELVYFGDEDGFVFAANAETGQNKWVFKADSKVVSDIVVIDSMAYFCSESGYLYALR